MATMMINHVLCTLKILVDPSCFITCLLAPKSPTKLCRVLGDFFLCPSEVVQCEQGFSDDVILA